VNIEDEVIGQWSLGKKLNKRRILGLVGAARPRRPTGADLCGERSLPLKNRHLHFLP
jgi:hypothetical protein